MTNTEIDQLLVRTEIPGLDIQEALSRMGNNSKIYLRIIHSFVTNMPGILGSIETATISPDTLEDYAVTIHGVKGSCYSVGAGALGDLAHALEIAAKGNDLQTILRDNDAFIESATELLSQLKALEAKIEGLDNCPKNGDQTEEPDVHILSKLLTAAKDCDYEKMSELIEELSCAQYVHDGDLITRIKASYYAFDYKAIEEAITEYLLKRKGTLQ